MNGGVCTKVDGSTVCKCDLGFVGPICEDCECVTCFSYNDTLLPEANCIGSTAVQTLCGQCKDITTPTTPLSHHIVHDVTYYSLSHLFNFINIICFILFLYVCLL